MTSSSQYLTIVKMETPTSTVSTRGRKRTSSQSSQGSSYRSSSSVSSSSNYHPKKKLKKYELDPSKDITVRNALAAKKNREKKKAEEIAMKQENMTLKLRLAQLEKEMAALKNQQKKLKESYAEEQNTYNLITPLGGSSTVKDALEAIMPRLNEKYGSVTINQTPCTTTTSSVSTNTCNTSNDNNHQVSHLHNTNHQNNNIVNYNNNNNNNNDNVVQTYVCLNDPVQWDASKYIEDFHLDDDVDIIFTDDDHNKYSQPGDLESSFNFNDLANFNDSQPETAEFLPLSQIIDDTDKKPLVNNSDPFFGLYISADKKNVIIDRKPTMMCPPKLLPDLKSMQSLTAEG